MQLSASPVLGGSVSTAAARRPLPSPAASLEKGWWEKGEDKSQRCECQCGGAGMAQCSSAAGHVWAGSWGTLSRARSLGSPHYLR